MAGVSAPSPLGLPSGLSLRITALRAGMGAAALGLGLAVAPQLCSLHREQQRHHQVYEESSLQQVLAGLVLASLSVAGGKNQVEKSTGVEFPEVLDDGKQLAGAGVRKKAILGLKNISVYAFGVYSHAESVRQRLGSKYGLGESVLPDAKELPRDLYADAISSDVSLTVRLVIVYGRLKMGSVRSSFEESLGARINRFGGAADRPLLTKFTGLFKDDIQLPKGTTIDIARLPGHVLQARVDGKEIGSVKSQLLCRSFFDLYIGEQPFDKQAKEAVGRTLLRQLTAPA